MPPTSSTKESNRNWLENLGANLRASLIHPLINALLHPPSETGNVSPEHAGISIPSHLLENQYALPLASYTEKGNWSKKAEMFANIAEVTSIVEKQYGVYAPMPSVIPLTHKLWEHWLENGQKFDDKTKAALADLLNQVKRSSDTNKLVIRHLEDDGNNGNVGARSYPGVMTIDDAIEKIEAQYRFFAQEPLRWQDKGHAVEVCVGIYPHADPVAFETTTKRGIETLSAGQPPIGIVVTTSQDGEKIKVDLVIGDNLAAQEMSDVSDSHYFNFADPNNAGKNSLTRSKPPKFGVREHIIQDRGGQLLETVKLPNHMHNRPIRLDETEIIRSALVAAVAAKKLGHDVKIEAALNHKGFAEINSLAKFEAPKAELLSAYEHEYMALGVINNAKDAEALANIDPDSLSLPPVIILGSKLKNSVGVSEPLEIIVKTIESKRQEAKSDKARAYWQNALILTTGTSASHHLDGLLNLTTVKHYIANKIPHTMPSDLIIFEEGRNPGDIWIRNTSGSGDGIYIISPEHWPKAFDPKVMGNKAWNHREVVSRNNLKSPPYIVLTHEAFLKILEENGVKAHYDKLLNGNGHTPIKEIFESIRTNLKFIPPEIWGQITALLIRKVGNADASRFLARSNSTIEDIGTLKRYAGAFETFNNLRLAPESNTNKYDSTIKPTTLSAGILSVISSMFTDELAEHLLSIKDPLERKRTLANWAMPVKIDKQVEAVISGVATALDSDTGNTDYLTVQAQAGIGGVVDGEQVDRPILTAKADRQTMRLTSLVVKYKDQEPIRLDTPTELLRHFPPELTEGFIISIMNAVDKVNQVSGKKSVEWAIDHEAELEPQLWFNQSR